MAGRPAELRLGARCSLSCAPCDCAYSASTAAQVERALRDGGERLVLRGIPSRLEELAPLLERAKGFGQVIIRTTGHEYAAATHAQALARAGAHGAILPLFSHVPEIHDRIAGSKDALVRTLMGARALSAAGLSVEFELPILSVRVQHLEELVALGHRAVPASRSVRFFAPRHPLPTSIAPSPWTEAGPRLAAAIRRARALELAVRLRPSDALPICALNGADDVLDAFRFDPRHTAARLSGCEQTPRCEGCTAARACPGVAQSYAAANGDAGFTPFRVTLRGLQDQRTTPARKWTPDQQRAAGLAEVLVIRPTVNCNQDCTFCSANETSKNVWTDPDEMIRAIARAGRRGVRHLSFSGGEPTLSRHLPRFIRAAKKVGIPGIEVVTNAVLLDSRKRVDELVEAGITNAFVSLHSHDEAISATLTQKRGDLPRTVRGIGNLLDAGVHTVLNHVITTRNYPYVERYVAFVHREFGGRAKISFAFVTPQFKALENLDLIPKLSEVMPYLRRAMRLAVTLGQHFVVGSRQGIPPCFLREFEAWSDALDLANESISEDAPQKARAPTCDECRYTQVCTGLWKVYVARHGTGELRAVAGPAMGRPELELLRTAREPTFGYIRDFESAPEIFRHRDAEAEPLEELSPPRTLSLPIFEPVRSRPLRLGLVGTGQQARRIARALAEIPDVTVDFVASPSAPEADLRAFGGCRVFRDASEAMDEIRPEAVIIASATTTHAALIAAARERGIPALVEKPFTSSLAQARVALAELSNAGTLVVPAHAMLHAPGLRPLWSGAPYPRFSVLRRTTAASPDCLKTWNGGALGELLYHLFVLTTHACGGGPAQVSGVQFGGDSVPERFRLLAQHAGGVADIRLEFAAGDDELLLRGEHEDDRGHIWHRRGRDVLCGPIGATAPLDHGGSDTVRMLEQFRDAVLGRAKATTSPADAYDVMRSVSTAMEAAVAAGVPLQRQGGPIHVASRNA